MHVEYPSQVQASSLWRSVAWRDFRLVFLGALVLLALVVLGDMAWFLSPLRLLLGVVYILYVPGYCLMAALFPMADDLDGIERAGVSLGLSVAIVPLLALLLDHLPWGLRLWPILLGEYVVIAVSIAVALAHRAHTPDEAVYVPDLRWRPRRWWRSLPVIEQRIYMLLGGVLLLAVVSAAWVFLVPAPDTFTTEFYMLGAQGKAEEFPRQVQVDQELSVTLGIVNRERETHTYRVEVWVRDMWQPGRRMQVKQSIPVALAPGESWRGTVNWRMPWAGDDQQIELLLFDGKATEPYRRLQFWVNVAVPGESSH